MQSKRKKIKMETIEVENEQEIEKIKKVKIWFSKKINLGRMIKKK